MTLHSQRFATETLIRLSEQLPNLNIILEYSVKPYRIDAYLPDYSICIEIDENDHSKYDQEKEFERSKFITSSLHCSWIRVNDSDTVENTVNYLLKQLSYYGISETVEPLLSVEPSTKSYRQQLKEFKEQQAEEEARLELERLKEKNRLELERLERSSWTEKDYNLLFSKIFNDIFEFDPNSFVSKSALQKYILSHKDDEMIKRVDFDTNNLSYCNRYRLFSKYIRSVEGVEEKMVRTPSRPAVKAFTGIRLKDSNEFSI